MVTRDQMLELLEILNKVLLTDEVMQEIQSELSWRLRGKEYMFVLGGGEPLPIFVIDDDDSIGFQIRPVLLDTGDVL